MTTSVHYSGAIHTDLLHCLAGWPACCTGARAETIASNGNQTTDRSKVTCRLCLALIEKHDEFKRTNRSTASGGDA